MAIDRKTRKTIKEILDGVDYRKIVSQRAECHPNTVSNVLLKGNDNDTVELQLMILAKEIKEAKNSVAKRKGAIAKQL